MDSLGGLDLPQLVGVYLRDRLVVDEWADEGSPRSFRPATPDPDRPPPTFRQAMATVSALSSHVDDEILTEILAGAPAHWLRAWVNEALAREGYSLRE